MYIDADCHISGQAQGAGIGADDLVRQMDAVGVQRAVCWPMVSYTREIAPDNRAIAEGARRYPTRIIPFGGINPLLGMRAAEAELRLCLDEYGVAGIKLNGGRDGYAIDDPNLSAPLVAHIAQAGRVLAVHCGADSYERTHPFRIARLSERFPDLPILVVHMGGVARPDLHDAVIALAARHPQWLLVDSETDYRMVLRALEVLGPARICYGSDTPFCPMRYEWGLRQVIYQDLRDDERALVLGGNIARLLGLDDARP